MPGTQIFNETIAESWQLLHGMNPNPYYVVGVDGLLRPATTEELEDYLKGGEYDEVIDEQDWEYSELD